MKCPYCGSELRLEYSTFVYNNDQSKGKVLVCSNYPRCDAYVSCHEGTDIPMGRVANLRLRKLRKEAHSQLDQIWKLGFMSRKEAYKWLAHQLKIPLAECHVGLFDIKRCQKTIYICRAISKRLKQH